MLLQQNSLYIYIYIYIYFLFFSFKLQGTEIWLVATWVLISFTYICPVKIITYNVKVLKIFWHEHPKLLSFPFEVKFPAFRVGKPPGIRPRSEGRIWDLQMAPHFKTMGYLRHHRHSIFGASFMIFHGLKGVTRWALLGLRSRSGGIMSQFCVARNVTTFERKLRVRQELPVKSTQLISLAEIY